MGVGCTRLIEFNDTGSKAGIFDDSDSVVSSFRLMPLLITTLNYWDELSEHTATVGSATVLTLSTHMTTPFSTGGNVYFSSSTASAVNTYSITNAAGQTVSKKLLPNAWKWSMAIDRYPWQSPTSRLALKCMATSVSMDKAKNYNSVSGSVSISGNAEGSLLDQPGNVDGTGAFSWETSYQGGASSSSLSSSAITYSGPYSDSDDLAYDVTFDAAAVTDARFHDSLTEDHVWLYFTFNHADYISWDPYTAYDEETTAATNSAGNVAYSVVLLVILAIFSVFMF